MTGPQVASLLDSFAATVEEALERCGVVVLPREVGAAFTTSRQQVTAVVEIDDPERDGTVAEVVQDGYAEIGGGKVVIPARIRLHRGSGLITGIPRQPVGETAKVDIVMSIDEDGLLQLRATERITGNDVFIKVTVGLSTQQLGIAIDAMSKIAVSS